MIKGIFLLAVRKSKETKGLTYCIGVHQLGTPAMEFIVGKTDNDREYNKGDEVSYIYNAEYFSDLGDALIYLGKLK